MNTNGLHLRGNPTVTISVLALCGLAGVVAATHMYVGLVAAAAVLVIAAGVALAGVTGEIILLPAVCCFVLLTRFDEEYAIALGDRFRIPVVYWVTGACLGLLLLILSARRPIPRRTSLVDAGFVGRYTLALALFLGVGSISIAFNHLFDPLIPERSLLGESLALGAVVLPMAFTAVIPLLPLSKAQHAGAFAWWSDWRRLPAC